MENNNGIVNKFKQLQEKIKLEAAKFDSCK
jgi:hypothetical protein